MCVTNSQYEISGKNSHLQSDVFFYHKKRGLYLRVRVGGGGGLISGSLCYDPFVEKLTKGSVRLLRPLFNWFYL